MKVSSYMKTIVAVVMAAGTAASVAMGDSVVTPTEMVNVALAVLGALGVYVVPNAPADDPKV